MTTTVDSKAIDRELAEISERRWTVLDRMNRVHTAIHYAVDDVREKRSGWRMTNTEACARLTELGVERVFCTMAFSTRTDKQQSMADKLASLAQ